MDWVHAMLVGLLSSPLRTQSTWIEPALRYTAAAAAQSTSVQSLPSGTPTADKTLVFEAASIKANTSGGDGVRFGFQPGGRFNGVNVSLQTLVRNAFRLQPFQMIGGPSWFATDRFDIVAKAADNATPVDMIEMVKALMADRFKLKFHFETRELSIYELVLARADGKLGPQLKPSSVDCAAAMRGAPPPAPTTPPTPNARPTCGLRTSANPASGATLTAGGALLAQLASNLSNAVGRTIVDRTGLTGGYDIDLSFIPDATMRPAGVQIAADGPSLFTALQEQLGLKLESAKGPVEVLVIDSAQKPVED